MADTPLLVSPLPKEHGEWTTLTRAVIRSLMRQGKSQRDIVDETHVPRTTIRRILKQESSRRDRKRTYERHQMLSIRAIRQIIQHISRDWSTRTMAFER